MEIRFVHAPVHTPEQVRDVIREARLIAEELADAPEEREAAFVQACKLLGARTSAMMQPEQVPLALPRMRTLPGKR